jgi:hypothetical protein
MAGDEMAAVTQETRRRFGADEDRRIDARKREEFRRFSDSWQSMYGKKGSQYEDHWSVGSDERRAKLSNVEIAGDICIVDMSGCADGRAVARNETQVSPHRKGFKAAFASVGCGQAAHLSLAWKSKESPTRTKGHSVALWRGSSGIYTHVFDPNAGWYMVKGEGNLTNFMSSLFQWYILKYRLSWILLMPMKRRDE